MAKKSLGILLSDESGVPYYLQIINQMKHLVASGQLVPGDSVPPTRELAKELKVNPNTVARAYRELESQGVLAAHRTTGTYVSDVGSPLAYQEKLKILTDRIDALLAESRHMNIHTEEVLRLLKQRDEVMRSSTPEK